MGKPPKTSMALLPPVMTTPTKRRVRPRKKTNGLQPSFPSFLLGGAEDDDVGRKTTASDIEGVKDSSAPGSSFGVLILAGTKDAAVATAASGTSGPSGFSFGTE